MDAKYKILFSGKFKSWVVQDEFVASFSEHLGASREKAAALYKIDCKVTLKKNLSDIEVERHMAAFEKMGMLVYKRLMLKPFVGPRIEQESRIEHMDSGKPQKGMESGDGCQHLKLYPRVIEQGRKDWSSLTRSLRSLVKKIGS